MARTEWKDRVVERPRTFTIENNADGTVTLVPAPGQIIESGTPVNAQNLNALGVEFDAHLAESATQAHLAKNIGLEDTAGNFVATEVEGAMNELFTNVSNGKSLVGGAITGVDPNVVIPTDPTFQDLASAIGGISTGKKWASGSANSFQPSYRGLHMIKVQNLEFKPSFVFAWGEYDYFGFATTQASSKGYYQNMDSGVNNGKSFSYVVTTEITNNGFEIPVARDYYGSSQYTLNWVAFE